MHWFFNAFPSLMYRGRNAPELSVGVDRLDEWDGNLCRHLFLYKHCSAVLITIILFTNVASSILEECQNFAKITCAPVFIVPRSTIIPFIWSLDIAGTQPCMSNVLIFMPPKIKQSSIAYPSTYLPTYLPTYVPPLENTLKAILETCDLSDIWSDWWGDMTWQDTTYPPTYLHAYLPNLN